MQGGNLRLLLQARKTQGYLQKKSDGLITKWQRRYFIIIEHLLCYYDDESLSRVKKKIRIDDIISVDTVSECEFHIVAQSRVYELRAPNGATLELWVASLTLIRNWKPPASVKKRSVTANRLKRRVHNTQTTFSVTAYEPLFSQVGLTRLAERMQQAQIKSKLIVMKGEHSMYFLVSCKTLEYSYMDRDFLSQGLIEPYSFNTIYCYPTQKSTDEVHEVCRAKDIAKVLYEKTHLVLFLHGKKLVLRLQHDVKEEQIQKLISKLKFAAEIGQEYHNSLKIVINRNIDKLLHQYQLRNITIKQIAVKEFQENYNINHEEKKKNDFFKKIENLKVGFLSFVNCCRVKKPQIPEVILKFAEEYYELFFDLLSRNWKEWQIQITQKDTKKLIKTIKSFHEIFSIYFQDARLLNGCYTLNKLLLSHYQKELISKINFSTQCNNLIEIIDQKSLQSYKSNSILHSFHTTFASILQEFPDLICESSQRFSLLYLQFCESVLKQIGQMLSLCLPTIGFSQYILSLCNQIHDMRSLLLPKVEVIWLQKKAISPYIRTEYMKGLQMNLTAVESLLIKRFFELIFSTMDRSILNRGFEQLDLGLICTCILDKIRSHGSIRREVRHSMYQSCYEEVCYFYYCCIVRGCGWGAEAVVAKIKADVHIMKAKFKEYVKEEKIDLHERDLERVVQFLECGLHELKKKCRELKKEFESSFDEKAMRALLDMRGKEREEGERICMDVLRVSSPEEMSLISGESRMDASMYSRKSIISNMCGGQCSEKYVYEGYLTKNYLKVETYFRILNKMIVEYDTVATSESIAKFQLKNVKKFAYPVGKTTTFALDFGEYKVTLAAKNQLVCLEWVTALCEELNWEFQKKNTKEQLTAQTCSSSPNKINAQASIQRKALPFIKQEKSGANQSKQGTRCCGRILLG